MSSATVPRLAVKGHSPESPTLIQTARHQSAKSGAMAFLNLIAMDQCSRVANAITMYKTNDTGRRLTRT